MTAAHVVVTNISTVAVDRRRRLHDHGGDSENSATTAVAVAGATAMSADSIAESSARHRRRLESGVVVDFHVEAPVKVQQAVGDMFHTLAQSTTPIPVTVGNVTHTATPAEAMAPPIFPAPRITTGCISIQE